MSKLYRFDLPEPSAKRLNAQVRFVVRCIGFGCTETVYAVEPYKRDIVWYGPDKLEHHDEWMLDADYRYRFHVEFSNVTGSRMEKYDLQPTEIAEFDQTTQFLLDAPSQETLYD